MADKCKCGKPAMHTVFRNSKQIRFCCTCYIQVGNVPADWHSECMREAGREKESRMTTLITNYNKEWIYWAWLFAYLWPNAWLNDLAEMADRMLYTFGTKDFIGREKLF